MENFLNFLQKTKHLLIDVNILEKIEIVIGNESCDLDSTISTLALSYLLYNNGNDAVFPILNVTRNDLRLRTLTCSLLEEFKIPQKFLIFKDEIHFKHLIKTKNMKTYLVDHHILSENDQILGESVVEIFDHRPINLNGISKYDNIKKLIINPVGSCTSLVTNEIYNNDKSILFNELAHLLYRTIIFDTIGLNKDFGRTSNTDITVASRLEEIIGVNERKLIFDKLWSTHTDTSKLSNEDLLHNDLKILHNIPIAVIPMLVETFLNRDDVQESVEFLTNEYNKEITILLGICAENNEVKRDVAIFFTNCQFKDIIVDVFKTLGAELNLIEKGTNLKNFVIFDQKNIKLTRKYILPLVNEAVNKFRTI